MRSPVPADSFSAELIKVSVTRSTRPGHGLRRTSWHSAVVLAVLLVSACTSSGETATSSAASDTSAASVAESSFSESVASTGADVTSAAYTGLDPTAGETEADANTGTAAAPSDTEPAVTTEVPAPGGGDINQTVAVTEVSTQPAVALAETGDYGNGVTVTLSSIEDVTTSANLPGEISGPGLKVTVQIVNDSGADIDLGNVIVDLQDAAGVPALPMSASPAEPFKGSLAAGATASGIYVFTVPTDYSNPANISVSYTTGAPVVLFVGDAK